MPEMWILFAIVRIVHASRNIQLVRAFPIHCFIIVWIVNINSRSNFVRFSKSRSPIVSGQALPLCALCTIVSWNYRDFVASKSRKITPDRRLPLCEHQHRYVLVCSKYKEIYGNIRNSETLFRVMSMFKFKIKSLQLKIAVGLRLFFSISNVPLFDSLWRQLKHPMPFYSSALQLFWPSCYVLLLFHPLYQQFDKTSSICISDFVVDIYFLFGIRFWMKVTKNLPDRKSPDSRCPFVPDSLLLLLPLAWNAKRTWPIFYTAQNKIFQWNKTTNQ